MPKEKIEFFHEHGYLTDIPVLTKRETDLLVAEVEDLMLEQNSRLHYLHAYSANASGDPDKAFHDLIFHPALVVATAQLLAGPDPLQGVRLWHDDLYVKPPKIGAEIDWQQDASYWVGYSHPLNHMTALVALDNQTAASGATEFIPGSHRWRKDGKPLRHPTLTNDIKSSLSEDELARWIPVCVPLQRGFASLHHPLTIHRSPNNSSETPSRVAQVSYCRDGTVSDTSEDILSGVRIPKGEPLQGDFFPLVFDPKKPTPSSRRRLE